MRYSLRTLVIVMTLGGPLGALAWREWEEDRKQKAETKVVGTVVLGPTLAFSMTNTTIGIPNEGSVLLGGIKRAGHQPLPHDCPDDDLGLGGLDD